MIYGILTAIMWISVGGTAAVLVSVVGAMLLGLMYVVTSPEHRGRPRSPGPQ
jgi:branched-subunit amino acid ABC-type transport system permease component